MARHDEESALSTGSSFLFLGVLSAAYLLPWLVAERRNHPQRKPIAIIAVALGWTVLGWIGALVWAVSAFDAKLCPPGSAPASWERLTRIVVLWIVAWLVAGTIFFVLIL